MKKMYTLALKVILLLLFFVESSVVYGQYNPLFFKELTFTEPSGSAQTNYQLMLELDTQTPILANQMNNAGNDIRFSFSKCMPFTYLDYFIESGINTNSTIIWVRIPSIAATATQTIYLFYGDMSAAAASNFSATFPNVLITGGNNITLTGVQNYDWIEVEANDTIFATAGASLTLQADRIKIDATGSCVSGVGKGFQPNTINSIGNGPGAGTTSTNSGSGGGSYAGVGGTGGMDAGDTPGVGGATYGTSSGTDFDMGSSGGSGSGISVGGAGGGAIKLEASLLSVNGLVDVSGGSVNIDGTGRGGGGGAGGSIYLYANKITGTGSLIANGSNGASGTSTANDSGGGGGGGRIKLNSTNTPTLGTSVTGGIGGPNGTSSPGQPGGVGSINTATITYNAPILSPTTDYYYLSTTVNPSTAICSGNPLTLTANGLGLGATYLWSDGTLTPSNGVAFVPTTSSTYTITGTDANTCVSTSTIAITLNSSPTVTANSLPSPAIVCAGASITLNGGGATTYTWSDGVNTQTDGVSFIPLSSSTYTVTGTSAGCSATASIDVIVNSAPIVTASASPSTTVNANTLLTLSGGGASSYTWSGPVPVTDNTPFTATLASNGTYTVTGTSSCGSSTATITINVVIPTFSVNSLVWGASPFQDSLWSVDTLNGWAVVNRLAPSLAGFTITGINSLAFDPCEFKTYAILKLSGFTTRHLATIDLPTGVCTLIGNLGDKFSSLTFRKDGQLFGVTGNGATNPETMYTIDKTTAVPTLAIPLGNGTDGEILSYNPFDDMIYHWSGNSTMVFEKFPSIAPYTPVTNIVTTGLSSGETFGALCLNPSTFLISNISSQFKMVTTSGDYGPAIGSLPDDLRGLVMLPKFETDKSVVCQKVDSVVVAAAAAQWYTVYYSWGDGTIDTVIGNTSKAHIYTSSGNKTLNVILNNGTCTPDTFWSKVITVNPSPVVTITGPNAFCTGGTIVLTGSSGGSSQWYQDGIAIPFATTNTYTVSTIGNYNMVKTNLNGCADSATVGKVITETPLPIVTANASPSTTLCEGSNLTLSGGGASTYAWSGPTAVTDAISFIPSTSATGIYTVTGTDAGCSSTATIAVTVNPSNASNIVMSSSAIKCQTLLQSGANTYSNPTCELIAKVDAIGLGTTDVCASFVSNQNWNGEPYGDRIYSITPTVNGTGNVCLYYTAADLLSAGITTDGEISITKVGGNGVLGGPGAVTEILNSSMAISNIGSIKEVCFPVSSFSSFYLHSINPNNVPLAVNVTNFSGRVKGSYDELSWTTTNERDFDYFNLQQSIDGVNFVTIEKIYSNAVNGNSNQTLNYAYKNLQPHTGHNYYRLQGVDKSGQNTIHTQVIDLFHSWIGHEISIYPNPAKDMVTIELYTMTSQKNTIQLIDMSGRMVKQIQASCLAGVNTLQMNIGDLSTGVYTIQVYSNGSLIHVNQLRKDN